MKNENETVKVNATDAQQARMPLRIYAEVIELIRQLAPVFARIAEVDADLARQGRRAACSIALNLAEGAGVRGGHRRMRNQTALGSAWEVAAVCDVAEALGIVELDAETRELLDKVLRTLSRLVPR